MNFPTIKSFYYGYSDSKYSTIKLISKWLDSKENISSLDNNTEYGKGTAIIWVRARQA